MTPQMTASSFTMRQEHLREMRNRASRKGLQESESWLKGPMGAHEIG